VVKVMLVLVLQIITKEGNINLKLQMVSQKLMRNQESDLLRKGIEMKGKSQQTLSRFINKTIWVTLGKMPTHLKKIFPKKKTTSNLLIQTKENHKM